MRGNPDSHPQVEEGPDGTEQPRRRRPCRLVEGWIPVADAGAGEQTPNGSGDDDGKEKSEKDESGTHGDLISDVDCPEFWS